MLAMLVLGGGALMIIVLAVLTAILMATGNWRWTPSMSRMGKIIWTIGFLITVAIATLWLGPVAVVAAWPLWVCMVAIVAILFLMTDFAYGFGSFRQKPKSTPVASQQSWDTLWRQHEGKPLPPWMQQAAQQGSVTYDGKIAQVENGRLIAQSARQSKGLEGLFDRLDRLLG